MPASTPVSAPGTDSCAAKSASSLTSTEHALDANSVALSQAIGGVYGADAAAAFLELWRTHIGFFVDYTTAVAKGDRAKPDAAVADLTGYADDFAAFLASANPNLPKATVSALVRSHVVSLKAVVDDQHKGDWAKAYAHLREAAAHMRMIGDPLAGAIAKQFPGKYAMQ